MILGYFLFIYSYIPTDLLNKCKMYNIKDTDCLNSSFIPSSEYNRYLQSFNMPVIRDDYCIKNKCMAVVSNESINNNAVQTISRVPDTPKINLTTLTSTSTVRISLVPAEKKEVPPPVVCIDKDTKEGGKEGVKDKCKEDDKDKCKDDGKDKCKEDCKDKCKEDGKDKCKDGGKEDGKDGGKDKCKEDGKDKCKDGGKDKCKDGGKEDGKDKKIREDKDVDKKEEDKNKKVDKDISSAITVIREIPTTITVDVPLTLYREFTTTSIEKVPIVNYELTTYTKSLISTETLYKTSTTVLTSEIIKTTTLTTSVEKTTTLTTSVEKTTTVVKTEPKKSEDEVRPPTDKPVPSEEPLKSKEEGPRNNKEGDSRNGDSRNNKEGDSRNGDSRNNKEDFKFPGYIKNLLKEESPTKQDMDKIFTSTIYVTKTPEVKTENTTTVTVSTTITTKPTVECISSPCTTVSKKEDDFEIIPLLKELLKAKTPIRKKHKEIKPKKNVRTIYRTVYAKKKKMKCSTIRLGEDPCNESTEF
ncbi:hypothetical protein P3W45_001315 [Vairimorpha bombi]|jgi:hypothetical protein